MANDFTGDSSCQAVWNFDTTGTLTTDSSPAAGGNGANTLTNDSVTCDSSDYIRGTGSAALGGTAMLSIAGASLSANYPGRSTDTSKLGTVCSWFKATSDGSNFCIYSQFDDVTLHKGTIVITWRGSGANTGISVIWVYSNDAFESWFPVVTVNYNQWYHFGMTWDGINKGLHLRMWDGSTVFYDADAPTFTNELESSNAPVQIGVLDSAKTWAFTGNIDEIVVFNRRLSNTEIDQIRSGTYSVGGYRLIPRGGMHCNLTVA